MQFISSLTIALLTLAMSARASRAQRVALTPDSVAAAGLTNIHDFQGNSLTVGGATGIDGTPVISFPSSSDGSSNQQERTRLIYWTFTPNGSDFVITSGIAPSLFLSYQSAPFGSTPIFAGMAVFSNLPTLFSLRPVSPPLTGVMIVSVEAEGFLTAWQNVPGITEAPVRTHISSSKADLDWSSSLVLSPVKRQLCVHRVKR
ncbi:hypothetical protein GGX14DRAFT_395303 [Mycena pura]|uniref:Uncharacterized protein n=1 Tax=Mycena pura TaxID=153505 RepID=A0AAD6Y9U0_9AGAR|nr:hypothetical protein GGX14DRAFT_395303 [Mycena pura]